MAVLNVRTSGRYHSLQRYMIVMARDDLRDQIARLESDIEQLAEGLERCRKAMLLVRCPYFPLYRSEK